MSNFTIALLLSRYARVTLSRGLSASRGKRSISRLSDEIKKLGGSGTARRGGGGVIITTAYSSRGFTLLQFDPDWPRSISQVGTP